MQKGKIYLRHSQKNWQEFDISLITYKSIKKVVLQCHLRRNNIEIGLKSFNSIHATLFTSFDTATVNKKSVYILPTYYGFLDDWLKILQNCIEINQIQNSCKKK